MKRIENGDVKQGEGLNVWPRTYAVEPKLRRSFDFIAVAPLGMVTSIVVLHLFGIAQVNNLFGLLAAGFLAAVIGSLLSRSYRRYVVLEKDSIAVVGWRSTRVLKRNEILGRRGAFTRYGYSRIMVPVDPAAGELHLPRNLKVDKQFFTWVEDIPQVRKKG